MAIPSILNGSTEIATKGASQLPANMINYILGSPDLLVFSLIIILAIVALVILKSK